MGPLIILFSNIAENRIFCVLFFLLVSPFLQQFVMLRDMVAAHSVLRVSVCRGNKGMFRIHEKATDTHTPVKTVV